MKLVATMMIRDEADIVAAMLEHHLAQGVDLIIVTDNGSIDGTREILSAYAEAGVVELHDDLRHNKQQSAVVSGMASRAYTVHGADWVINVDADEFFVPVDTSLTLKQAFERIPVELGAFTAPVTNLSGAPGRSGSGLDRLVLRDLRSDEVLQAEAGLFAQPTPNAIHVGREGVTVAQGNHFVDIESAGQPQPEVAIEVLHLPWRSFAQFGSKTVNAGRAYEGNPNLNPSPRHHGMRDYRFEQAGILEQFYLHRHPAPRVERDSVPEGFVLDDWLFESLTSLSESGAAVVPEALERALTSSAEADFYTAEDFRSARALVSIVLPVEVNRTEALAAAVAERKATHLRYKKAVADRDKAKAKAADLSRQLAEARAETEALRSSRSFTVGNRLLAPARAIGRLTGK